LKILDPHRLKILGAHRFLQKARVQFWWQPVAGYQVICSCSEVSSEKLTHNCSTWVLDSNKGVCWHHSSS